MPDNTPAAPAQPAAVAPETRPRWPVVTAVACSICVILFVAISMNVPEPSWDALAKWGYLSAERVWDGGYWGLVSSAFVHLALWHVAFNVYWFWQLGSAAERALGPVKYLAFLMAAAAVSSSIQLAVSGTTGHGASGVVYAIFGLMWVGRKAVPSFATTLRGSIAAIFMLWLVGCIVASLVGTVQIGNAAHVSGLLFGAVAAHWLVLTKYRNPARWMTLAFFLASLAPLFWSPWSAAWVAYRAYKAHVALHYDSAIAGYRRSIVLGGDRASALYGLALAYHEKGATAEYLATLAELRQVNARAAAAVEGEFRGEENQDAEESRRNPAVLPNDDAQATNAVRPTESSR